MNGSVLCHCLRLAALAVPVRRALSEEQRQREAVAAKREEGVKRTLPPNVLATYVDE